MSMKCVFIYGFQAKFVGNEKYEYSTPNLGDTHKCMLFLAQEISEVEFDNATIEIGKYGFEDVENLAGNRLKVEVLSSDSFKGFAGFYTEALSTGSSLVFYPNT